MGGNTPFAVILICLHHLSKNFRGPVSRRARFSASEKRIKKTGEPPMDPESSPKKAHKHKWKGKENADSEFRSVKASVVLAVPPVFANRLRDGVEEMLDTMTMRCALEPMHFRGHSVLI